MVQKCDKRQLKIMLFDYFKENILIEEHDIQFFEWNRGKRTKLKILYYPQKGIICVFWL